MQMCVCIFILDFSPFAVNRVCLLNVANKKEYFFWNKSLKYLIDHRRHRIAFNLPGCPLQDRQCNRLSPLLSEKKKRRFRIDICRGERMECVSIAWNRLINYPYELSNIITRVLKHLSFICNSFYRQVFTAQDSEQWGNFKWFKNTVNKLIKASCLQSLRWQMDYTMKALFHILSILRSSAVLQPHCHEKENITYFGIQRLIKVIVAEVKSSYLKFLTWVIELIWRINSNNFQLHNGGRSFS